MVVCSCVLCQLVEDLDQVEEVDQQCLPGQKPCGNNTCCASTESCCEDKKANITGCAPPNTVCCPFSPNGYCFTQNETCCKLSDTRSVCGIKGGVCCPYESEKGFCYANEKCCRASYLSIAKCIPAANTCCLRYGNNYPSWQWSCNPGLGCCTDTGEDFSNTSNTCYDLRSQSCCSSPNQYNKVCSFGGCCLDMNQNGVCLKDNQKCCYQPANMSFVCDKTQACCTDGSYVRQCCAAPTVCCPSLINNLRDNFINRFKNIQEKKISLKNLKFNKIPLKEPNAEPSFCANPASEFCCEHYDFDSTYQFFYLSSDSCPLGKLCCKGNSNVPYQSVGSCCAVNATSYKCTDGYLQCP